MQTRSKHKQQKQEVNNLPDYKSHLNIATEHKDHAKKLFDHEQYQEALHEYDLAINTLQQLPASLCDAASHKLLNLCYYQKGVTYDRIGNQTDEEIKCYLAAIAERRLIAVKEREPNHFIDLVKYEYRNLIQTYLEQNDQHKALACCEEIKVIIKNNKNDNNDLIANLIDFYQKIARSYLHLWPKDFTAAEQCFKKAFELSGEFVKPSASRYQHIMAKLWFNFGSDLFDGLDQDKEKSAYHNALKIYKLIPNDELTDHDKRCSSMLNWNLAVIDANLKQTESEILRIQNAIRWLEQLNHPTPKDKRELALFNIRLSTLKGDTPECIAACKKVLEDQPPVDYRNNEYANAVADWKARVERINREAFHAAQKRPQTEWNNKLEHTKKQKVTGSVSTLFTKLKEEGVIQNQEPRYSLRSKSIKKM